VMILLMAPKPKRPLIALGVLCIIWEAMRGIAHWRHIQLSDYRMIIYSLALIIMMILRPQGLFGTREIWDYLPRRLRRSDGR
jgi:ABC-type branched-subunit amino acid transport system permease subunit